MNKFLFFFKKIFRYFFHKVVIIINKILLNFTLMISPETERNSQPLIFIIGPPRSGSTLLYQVLTQYYDFGYLNNFHAKFFGSPGLIEKIFRVSKYQKKSAFDSNYGRTNGLFSPSECGAFWYQFFRRKPQYVSIDDVESKNMRGLKKTINLMGCAFKKPILFKNLNCTLRLIPTFKALPNIYFIVIRRNILDNAHSILEGRYKAFNNYSTWWAQEPPEIDSIKSLSPEEQVFRQINDMYELIKHSQSHIPSDRFFEVQYENLCDSPHSVLEELNDFFLKNNIRVSKKNNEIPRSFSNKRKIKINMELYLRLKKLVFNEK